MTPLSNTESYEGQHLESSYTKGFGTLYTREQKRRIFSSTTRGRKASLATLSNILPPGEEPDEKPEEKPGVNISDYLLKAKAGTELGRTLNAKSNYSFGGRTSFVKLRHIKPKLA